MGSASHQEPGTQFPLRGGPRPEPMGHPAAKMRPPGSQPGPPLRLPGPLATGKTWAGGSLAGAGATRLDDYGGWASRINEAHGMRRAWGRLERVGLVEGAVAIQSS